MQKRVRAVKSKPKALRHFKVDPVLKIDETFCKQAESNNPQFLFHNFNIKRMDIITTLEIFSNAPPKNSISKKTGNVVIL